MARSQDGDLDAFAEVVARYEGRLYRYAYHMVGHRQDAEDIVQDTMIRAWRGLPALTAPGAFGGWVYRIAFRRCMDVLHRAETRHTEPCAPEELPAQPRDSGPADPAAHAEVRGQMEDVARLVRRLPPEQRACWLMREVQQHSYGEIAQALAISESTVRGRLARARATLAKGMTPWQ